MLSQLDEILGRSTMGNVQSARISPAIFRNRKSDERLTIIKERGLEVGVQVALEHGGSGVITEITVDHAIKIRGLRGSFHPRVVRRA